MKTFEQIDKEILEKEYLRGYIDGANAAYEIIDQACKLIPGIGPKTQQKIEEAIRKQYESMKNQTKGEMGK